MTVRSEDPEASPGGSPRAPERGGGAAETKPPPANGVDSVSSSAPDRLAWAWQSALRYWRPLILALLCVQLPVLVLNRLELPFGISFGYRSFARNVAILMVLGVLVGARGLPRPRSPITVPLLVFFAAAWLSVAVNGGRLGDVRSLGFTFGLFVGAASIASSAAGRRWLYHWLGLAVMLTVAVEVQRNPDILQLRESLRNTMITAHPNTLGAFFALLAPLFVGTLDDRSARWMAPLYLACAVFGAMLTFSRLALAGIFLGAATVLLVSWFRRHPVRVAILGAVAAVAAVGTILYLSLGRAEADWQRLRIISTSLTLFVDHWPFGIGFGAENLEVLFPARYEEMHGASLWLYHSHNMYVDLLVATGVVGAACAAWLFYRLAAVAWAAVRASQGDPRLRGVGGGFAGTVVVFLLLGVGDIPLYHERLLVPLAISWGLMDGWVRSAQTRPS